MKVFADPAVDRRFGRVQWRMLIATMIGYTLFYFMRKNFSFAMPGLQQDCGITKSMLGNFLLRRSYSPARKMHKYYMLGSVYTDL